MSLRAQAELDLASILEDSAFGFGGPVTITDPAGNSAALTGYSGDISQTIDPDTGVAIAGTHAHCTLRISSLRAAGLDLPKDTPYSTQTPWVVRFDSVNGTPRVYKVMDAMPDHTLGIVACILEPYEP